MRQIKRTEELNDDELNEFYCFNFVLISNYCLTGITRLIEAKVLL